ncbi:molybdenum cofactor synthesis protein [Plectosphaerella plurivora]|uniref:Adenylyltransferase and sulfurtransferase uba4 n=1 Tax=Plectosphaerella plurivora TaxID=936078 RepID=A0A9P8VH07_9PEZI|nr:molybdenum cofactor synthesis protein [Plectosphaerella plurivora]
MHGSTSLEDPYYSPLLPSLSHPKIEPSMGKLEDLRAKVAAAEAELQQLRAELAEAEVQEHATEHPADWKWPLSEGEYERYGRQLIIPAVGIKGQLRLKASSVLIIGAGGLGSPAAAYIAGAGVGTLGLVDGDTVETSNLHRQVAHATSRVGMLKVESAISYLRDLNPRVNFRAHTTHLTPQNAEDIVSKYDLVLDCTDHPTSRYLISDICVLLGKPLVSASAFKTDGQLIVLNNPPAPQGAPPENGGPCYRCVFPKPPPPDSVISCGEGGILGPVVGVMGILQALEAIKLIAAGAVDPTAEKPAASPPSLLLFSGTSIPPFRSVRMRGRRKDCFACSAASSLTRETLTSGSLDYVQFCGVTAPLNLLQPEERISATEYSRVAKAGSTKPVLLDVREREHFNICSLPGATSIPLAAFLRDNQVPKEDEEQKPSPAWLSEATDDTPIYVVCRVGNDSQLATRRLKEMGLDRNSSRFIGDIRGGMRAWKEEVDSTLPFT